MNTKKGKEKRNDKKASRSMGKLFIPKRYLGEIILAAGMFLAIKGMIKYNDGYDWLFNKMLSENREFETRFADSSMEKRLENKIGFDLVYLNFINKNTLEDAIIVMPVDTEFFPKGEESHFDKNINTLGWASYFVYPRRIVSYKEPRTPLFQKATHMALVNKYGYERLPYKVDFPYRYAVLPINPKKNKK